MFTVDSLTPSTLALPSEQEGCMQQGLPTDVLVAKAGECCGPTDLQREMKLSFLGLCENFILGKVELSTGVKWSFQNCFARQN